MNPIDQPIPYFLVAALLAVLVDNYFIRNKQ